MQPSKNLKETRFFGGNPVVSLVSGTLVYKEDKDQSTTLALINVPLCTDLRELFDNFRQYSSTFKCVRVFKSQFPRYYMTVILFKSLEDSERFYQAFDEKLFNLAENYIYMLKKVSHVFLDRIADTPNEISENSFSQSMTTVREDVDALFVSDGSRSQEDFSDSCSICLELFNDNETWISILCGHKLHLKCLVSYEKETCPVCRYQQHPSELVFCEKCDKHEDLWKCIVCGFVGCGGEIPIAGHIHEHANESNHIYSKRHKGKSVWDHSKADYVRMEYNRQFGEMVESESNDKNKKGKKGNDSDLLNDQISIRLESQREHYERELRELEAEYRQRQQDNNEISRYIQSEVETLESERDAATRLYEDTKAAESSSETMLNDLNRDLQAIRKLNQKLRKQKKDAEEVIEVGREQKKKELQDIKAEIAGKIIEVKDMKIHLDNKKKIEALPVQIGSPMMILETGGGRKIKK